MWETTRPKLTFANVMVVILAFIVLGGGAYAASYLPRNSVGTKQIKNGAVTKRKISKGARRALRGATGPRGPQGEPGTALAGGTVPVGTTLRGVAVTGATNQIPSMFPSATGISFGGFQLPTRPVAHIIPPGGAATTACPGSAATPEASSGQLCIYAANVTPDDKGKVMATDPSRADRSGATYDFPSGTSAVLGDGSVSRFGFYLGYAQELVDTPIQFEGTWAVTG